MSTTVTPSGGDDYAAVQAAIRAGGVVTLAGTCRISTRLEMQSGVTIQGGGLQWTGGDDFVLKGTNLTDWAVRGVNVQGAGLKLEGGSRITITKCTFGNPQTNNYFSAGVWCASINASAITCNTFQDVSGNGSAAIAGFDPDGTAFDHNLIVGTWEGIHIVWSGHDRGRCTVSWNVFRRVFRFAIELQGAPQTLMVQGNHVSDWTLRTDHMAMSVATGGDDTTNSHAVTIRDNVLIGNGDGYINDKMLGIEAMGDGLLVQNNLILNYTGGMISSFNPNMRIIGNTYAACRDSVPWGADAGPVFTPIQIADNIILSTWDGVDPGAPVDPAGSDCSTTPAPTGGTPSAGRLTAAAVVAGAIDLAWTDGSAASFDLARDGASIATLSTGTTSHRDSGLVASSTHNYVLTPSGGSPLSASATVLPAVSAPSVEHLVYVNGARYVRAA